MIFVGKCHFSLILENAQKDNVPQMIKLSVKTSKLTTLPCPFVHSHSSYTRGIPRTENIFMESAAELS